METMQGKTRLHPVLWVAAVAVTIFSAVGIGAITGILPIAGSSPKSVAPLTATMPALQPQTGQPADTGTTLAATVQPAPAPVAAHPTVEPEPKPVPKKQVSHAKPKPVQVAQNDYAPAPVVERSPARSVEPPAPVASICKDCGMIESVRELKQQGEGSGVGAVAGGVLGGVLGHQVGGGRGKDVATVLGAVGGAIAGHQVEKTVRTGSKYEILVRYDDGSSQKFEQEQAPAWHSGDRVKVVNGVITAN